MLADYEKAPAAEAERAESIRRVLANAPDRRAETAYDSVLKSDVPALDHAAFVAMVKQMFGEETGSTPAEISVGAKDLAVENRGAQQGIKQQLDSYARALGRSAWLMSIKCGCEAGAVLSGEAVGAPLLKARFAPGFKRTQVGLP